MEKEFVPYQQSLALKELGFDEPCFGIYSKYHGQMKYSFLENTINSNFIRLGDKVNHLCTTPLYQQAFRWFREKYGLFIRSDFDVNYLDKLDEFQTTYFFSILKMEESLVGFKPLGRLNNEKSYEEAELECLKKLIEIVKQK